MNDLIQRLTQTTQFHENADVTTKEVVDALEKQQAEIEQLADELNAMKDWKNSMRDKMEELKAQAAKDAADAGRLRESLRWALARVEKLAPHQAIEGDAALYEIATARAAMEES